MTLSDKVEENLARHELAGVGERLVAVNGLVDADDILAGDRLRVPLSR